MRRVYRLPLSSRAAKYLNRKQREVNDGAPVDQTWRRARKTAAIKNGVLKVLQSMCGVRQRCMFCADSRGVDIEHFWPKSCYRHRVFLWDNLLLVCTGCNRKKGNRFDLDENGRPLLIDPSAEEPWDYLFYEPRTGWVVARHSPDTGLPSPKGQHTTDPSVLPLNVEAVTEGRQRTHRNLFRAIKLFLKHAQQSSVLDEAKKEMLTAVSDNDDYGLVEWLFLREGSEDACLQQLKRNHPDVWAELQAYVQVAPR